MELTDKDCRALNFVLVDKGLKIPNGVKARATHGGQWARWYTKISVSVTDGNYKSTYRRVSLDREKVGGTDFRPIYKYSADEKKLQAKINELAKFIPAIKQANEDKQTQASQDRDWRNQLADLGLAGNVRVSVNGGQITIATVDKFSDIDEAICHLSSNCTEGV